MILFIGDSFTWGQGLQYYPLVENKGWTWEDCERFHQSNRRFEMLGFEEDEFRKTHSFPYLVAKELGIPFQTPRFENGSDNQVSYGILESIQDFISTNNIFLVVIQFSSPSRSILNGNEPKFNTIEKSIEHQVNRIANILETHNIDWLGVSWQMEIGEILKTKYQKNYVPITYKNSTFSSFDSNENPLLNDLFISKSEGITDGHFNLKGHQIIADSIVKKFKSLEDLNDKLTKSKRDINDFIFRR